MTFHTSLRTLPVWNFYEVLKSHSLRHLYLMEGEVPKKDEEALKQAWIAIYDEYCIKAKISAKDLRQVAKVEDLKLRYAKIQMLLSLTNDRDYEVRLQAKEALKGYNYLIRPDKPFPEEMKRLKSQLSSFLTKIKIEESKLPKDQKIEVDLMKQAIALENMFNRTIDIYEMPMEKWIALNDLANERIKKKRQ